MKTFSYSPTVDPLLSILRSLCVLPFKKPASMALVGFFASAALLSGADVGKSFPSPQEAVKALGQAVNSTDRVALAVLFGPASETVANPDPVQGAREFAEFAAAFNTTNRLVRESDVRMIIEVGPNGWPFPIPLAKSAGGWRFDTEAGLEEILNRRVGRNELEVLRVVRAYVEAQREYASKDRDGDDVLEFAQKLISTPGTKDGLYWPLDLDGEVSPLGPLAAQAQFSGYDIKSREQGAGPEPFHGYFFKVLTRQDKSAAGGKYDYVINGNMIGGFALVAWPADYGNSGIMTFIVNQQGRVYQKDLGPKTVKLVE